MRHAICVDPGMSGGAVLVRLGDLPEVLWWASWRRGAVRGSLVDSDGDTARLAPTTASGAAVALICADAARRHCGELPTAVVEAVYVGHYAASLRLAEWRGAWCGVWAGDDVVGCLASTWQARVLGLGRAPARQADAAAARRCRAEWRGVLPPDGWPSGVVDAWCLARWYGVEVERGSLP